MHTRAITQYGLSPRYRDPPADAWRAPARDSSLTAATRERERRDGRAAQILQRGRRYELCRLERESLSDQLQLEKRRTERRKALALPAEQRMPMPACLSRAGPSELARAGDPAAVEIIAARRLAPNLAVFARWARCVCSLLRKSRRACMADARRQRDVRAVTRRALAAARIQAAARSRTTYFLQSHTPAFFVTEMAAQTDQRTTTRRFTPRSPAIPPPQTSRHVVKDGKVRSVVSMLRRPMPISLPTAAPALEPTPTDREGLARAPPNPQSPTALLAKRLKHSVSGVPPEKASSKTLVDSFVTSFESDASSAHTSMGAGNDVVDDPDECYAVEAFELASSGDEHEVAAFPELHGDRAIIHQPQPPALPQPVVSAADSVRGPAPRRPRPGASAGRIKA
jgi:hypothetical protein